MGSLLVCTCPSSPYSAMLWTMWFMLHSGNTHLCPLYYPLPLLERPFSRFMLNDSMMNSRTGLEPGRSNSIYKTIPTEDAKLLAKFSWTLCVYFLRTSHQWPQRCPDRCVAVPEILPSNLRFDCISPLNLFHVPCFSCM